MAEGLGGDPGGIDGLCRELDSHGEAIEYDLIALGLRLDNLGTPALSWRDLKVILANSAPRSAYARAVAGGDAEWTLTDHLLALTIDTLAMANWQRQGKPHSPKPQPVTRPGSKSEARHVGRDPIPIRDFDAWWYAQGG